MQKFSVTVPNFGGAINGMYLFFCITGYPLIAQPGTDQHEGRVTRREVAHHTGATANPPVQSLDDVVGTDMSSVFAGKSTVSQGFFDAVRPLIVFHDVKLKFDG